MTEINKDELAEFVDQIKNFYSVTHFQKIIIFGYYVTNIFNEPFFDKKIILQCYNALDVYPPANMSDSLQKLKDGKKLIPVDGGYRVARSEIDKIVNLLKSNVGNGISNKHEIDNPLLFSSDNKTLQTPAALRQITQSKNFDKTHIDESKVIEALTLIKQFDTLQLPKFRIVGSYVRFDNDIRNMLKNMKQKIIAGLQPHAVGNENYLIWGSPGSGKSYFIQEIAKSLADDVHYLELNLAKLDQKQFQMEIAKLDKIEKACICLVDEVDSELSGKWAYESLLTHLFPSTSRKIRICFILAGSGGLNMEEMKKRIGTQNKGKDLLSRIPNGNEYVITPLNTGDNLIVGASQMMQTATKFKKKIREVEKLALFYIAVSPQFTSARQVSDLVSRSIGRIQPGEDRIKYDNLFEPGDRTNKEFWKMAESLDPSLIDSFILIEDDVS